MMRSDSFLWELIVILLKSAASTVLSVGLVAVNKIPNRRISYTVTGISGQFEEIAFHS